MKNIKNEMAALFLLLFFSLSVSAQTDFNKVILPSFKINAGLQTPNLATTTKCKIDNQKGWPKFFPDMVDCSQLSWSAAFAELHQKVSHEYAYTKWRGIDWDSLYSQFEPRILAAEQNEDKSAYYEALREYLLATHDGHVWIAPGADDIVAQQFVANESNKHIGGSYGLIITNLDNGKFIISYVSPESPAYGQIKPGDEITSWNYVPMQQVLQQTSITWSNEFEFLYTSYNPATLAGIEYERLRLLTRAPIGEKAFIRYISADTKQPKIISLLSFDDNGETLNRTNLYANYDPNKLVDYRILASGYGYLKISEEDDDSSSKVLENVQAAIALFTTNKVPGVILDLRGNLGGSDDLAANIAGFFTRDPLFYESSSYYNKNTKHFAVVDSTNVTPQSQIYTGPVVILTNVGTISSGEGVPMIAKKLTNLHILSFSPNTQGSFGMNVPMVKMPGDFTVTYPIGRSLNQKKIIQVDANQGLIGGVQTDVKIPMDIDTAIAVYNDQEDKALEFAENCLQKQCWLVSK